MLLNFEEMLALCETKPELRAKEEVVGGRTVTIFTYMVAMSDTFDSPLALEFRGTTFDNETGECICRPFRKFFNVGERPESQEHLIDWENAKFFTKHDGSMLTPVMINGEVHWKTKKSFSSDVAIAAAKYANANPDKIPWLTEFKAGVLADFTPIYEYVGPTNQIVLPYEEEQFIFLGANCIMDGHWNPSPALEVKGLSLEEVMDLEELEGFVICDGTQIVKAKTTWYMERHKICSEFNVKAIINATLNETVDDMLGTIAQLGLMLRYYQVQELRNKVATEQLFLEEDINLYWDLLQMQKLETRKEQAIYLNSGACPKEYISIMFKMLDNKDTTEMQHKIVFERCYNEFRDAEVTE